MPPLPSDQHQDVVIALLALERYLLSGGRATTEAQGAYAALRHTYRGPSEPLLNRFGELASAEEEGSWMAAVRLALEEELDSSAWRATTEQERTQKTTNEPHVAPRAGDA